MAKTNGKSKGGRPSSLTPTLFARLIKCIESGDYIEGAAAKCGIHKQTIYRWLKKGHLSRTGIHREFCDAVIIASDTADEKYLEVIDRAAFVGESTEITSEVDAKGKAIGTAKVKKTRKPDWQAAKWRLQKRNPRRYHDQYVDEDSVPQETLNEFMFMLVETLEAKLDGEKAKEIIEAIQDQLPGGEDQDYFVQRRIQVVYQGNGQNGHAAVCTDPYLSTLPPAQQHLASEIPGLGMRPEIGQDPLDGGNGGPPVSE